MEEQKELKSGLAPAIAVIVVIGLIFGLIMLGDNPPPENRPPLHDSGSKEPWVNAPDSEVNEVGMSSSAPSVDAAEWKPGPNGVRIWDVQEGTKDPVPDDNRSVKIHYSGWTKDGKQFDSSRGNQPAEFQLRSLVRGWQVGIPGMKVGGIRRLLVPYDMAYGEQGRPPKIPARADLIFEIKLLAYEK